jgi:hypothetical protein
MTILGTFVIEDYTVTIDGVDENRQRIIYYDLDNSELTRSRYYGEPDDILDGYTKASGCPIRVMRWQFRAQLGLEPSTDVNFTTLKDQVDYVISQMTGSQKIITEEAWLSANTISRISPTVNAIEGVVGLNESQVDNIFISASLLSL